MVFDLGSDAVVGSMANNESMGVSEDAGVGKMHTRCESFAAWPIDHQL